MSKVAEFEPLEAEPSLVEEEPVNSVWNEALFNTDVELRLNTEE